MLSGAKRAELGIFIYSTLVEQLLCAIVGTAVGAVYTAVTKTDKTCCLIGRIVHSMGQKEDQHTSSSW